MRDKEKKKFIGNLLKSGYKNVKINEKATEKF